jgi:hypothetical protein
MIKWQAFVSFCEQNWSAILTVASCLCLLYGSYASFVEACIHKTWISRDGFLSVSLLLMVAGTTIKLWDNHDAKLAQGK